MSEQQFNKAADDIKKLKADPSNDQKLELYGLYKQATVGDVNTSRPGIMDLTGKAKWDAWNSRKGMSKQQAQDAYIKATDALIQQHGLK